jgi:hypothetical protein
MQRLFLKIFIAATTLLVGIVSVYVCFKPTPQIADVPRSESQLVTNTPKSEVQRVGDSIIKNDGWKLPDISQLKKDERRQRVEQTPNVYLTVYETGERFITFKNQFDGTVSERDEIRIGQLFVYGIDGRRFCYRMLYSDVPKSGESAVGLSIYYSFYDLDGDGKFETWALNDSIGKPLKMPSWVKR